MSGFEFNEDMALKLVFQRADDPEPIGVLDFSGPEMTFSGRADESAKAFFDAVIKNQVGWNERQLDVRREVERELAAAKAELAAERATTASLLRTIALIREAGGFTREDLEALPGAVKAMREQRDEARDTAATHKRHWYEAKTEYGTALGKVRAELAAERATTASLLRTIALIREAGVFTREDLEALPGAVKAMREQRDEARELYCRQIAYDLFRTTGVFDPQQVAIKRGWAGLFRVNEPAPREKEGGGA